MNELELLQNYLLVGGLLVALGLTGFIVRRNVIVMFLCAEMILQGVSLSLMAWSRYHNDWGGQVLVIFVIAVAACEAAIALALVLLAGKRSDSLDILVWQQMREPGIPPHVDREIPEQRERPRQWPTLTPAGIRPQADASETLYRSRV